MDQIFDDVKRMDKRQFYYQVRNFLFFYEFNVFERIYSFANLTLVLKYTICMIKKDYFVAFVC